MAITSSFHPTSDTHEPSAGKGSNLMGLLLTTLMTDGGSRVPHWLKFLGRAARYPTAPAGHQRQHLE